MLEFRSKKREQLLSDYALVSVSIGRDLHRACGDVISVRSRLARHD